MLLFKAGQHPKAGSTPERNCGLVLSDVYLENFNYNEADYNFKNDDFDQQTGARWLEYTTHMAINNQE